MHDIALARFSKNYKVSAVQRHRQRMIAVLSCWEKPGAMFSREEQIGFYGWVG